MSLLLLRMMCVKDIRFPIHNEISLEKSYLTVGALLVWRYNVLPQCVGLLHSTLRILDSILWHLHHLPHSGTTLASQAGQCLKKRLREVSPTRHPHSPFLCIRKKKQIEKGCSHCGMALKSQGCCL